MNQQMVKKKMVDHKLDTIGLKCPMPVLKAKKVIKKMSSGESFKILSDDPGAKSDIPPLLKKTGCHLEGDIQEENGVFSFHIIKD